MKNKSDISKMLNILNNLYVASLLYRECGMKGESVSKRTNKDSDKYGKRYINNAELNQVVMKHQYQL